MKKISLAIIVLLSLISLSIGNMHFSWIELFQGNSEVIDLFLTSRLPRLLSIILVGIGLSISGLILQQLVRNKFVSPSTAATADSARLGIIISLIVLPQISNIERSLFAFIFAMIGTSLFVFFISKIKFKDLIFTPLVGLMLGMVIDSITNFLALRYDLMQVLSSYMLGNFTLTIKGRYELLFILIPTIFITYLYARSFNIAALGREYASNLGLNYNRVMMIGIVIISINSSIIISTIGNISFVGLIIPNIVSLMYGDKIDNTLSLTAMFGTIFLLGSDILSRLIIYPYEIPISLTVGILGSVIFLILIFRGSNNE